MKIETFGNFYTSTPLALGQLEKFCIENLKKQIIETSTYECNLIVNCTWIHPDEHIIIDWVMKHIVPNSTKIYFTAFIDGIEWFTRRSQVKFLSEQNIPYEFIGFNIDNWCTFLPCLLKKYTAEEVKLESITNLYLSLNRKPRPHREKLISLLIENNLIDRGHITFEKGYFEIIDNKTGNTEQHLHNEDLRFSRPEDIQTLGDLGIWKSSYCVIVSETDEHDPWHISEKTWKPIMGMRPFIHNSNKHTYKVLEKLNLYTPAALFKNNGLNKADPITVMEQIKSLYNKTPDELFKLYNEQYEMLTHNNKIFLEMVKGKGICSGCDDYIASYVDS